ncbi:MAG: cytochrome b, partial [Pseudomonadales bacterium]
LYVLPAAIITIGWAETDFGGHGVEWFGIAMPKVFPTMETLWGLNLEETTATLHKWFAYTMLGIAIIHVAAVVKHRWIDGNDVLYRMTFGTEPNKSREIEPQP